MFILLSFISLLSSVPFPTTKPAKVGLTVDIQNVRKKQGAVYIALFEPGKTFPEGKPMEGKKIDANNNSLKATFTVEPGEYAIAVYHDENSNGKMDKRIFGIPKEPYGFSNDFRPTMSAPTFSDCQFKVGDGGKAISIKLN